jgi:hypothetical protein
MLDRLATFIGPLQGVRDVFDDQVADALAIRFVLTDDRDVATNLQRGLSAWVGGQPYGGPTLKIPPEGVGQRLSIERTFSAVLLPSVRCSTPTRLRMTFDGEHVATVELPAGESEALFRFEHDFSPEQTHGFELRSTPPWAEILYSDQDRLAQGTRTHGGREASGDLTFMAAQRIGAPYEERTVWSYGEDAAWLLENPDALSRVRLLSGRGECSFRDVSPVEVEVSCDTEAGGTVLLAGAVAAGWRALGETGPLELRSLAGTKFDGLLAVDVPAGKSRVRFVYRSEAVRQGVVASGVCALLACMGLLLGFRFRA